MATRTVTYHSVGPFPYDDTLYSAVNTDGQLLIGQAPTLSQHVLRLADLTTILGSALPLSVGTASVVGTATKASREDHVHSNASIISAATPLSVGTIAAVGTALLFSREDHVHSNANILGTAVPSTDAETAVVGTATLLSRQDHVHVGVILSSATPISVATTAVVGVGTRSSRDDHVHVGVDLASAQTITGRKTAQTDIVCPLVLGSVASGGTLTLRSTEHVTKGKILFGTSSYDEVNDRLGIGTAAPLAKLAVGIVGHVTQAGYTNLEIGGTGGAGIVSAGTDVYLTQNAYVTGGVWSRSTAGLATYYNQIGGVHAWNYTATGAADSAITWSTALRLDANANVGIGSAAARTGVARLFIDGATAIAATDWALTSGWGANATISAVSGNDIRGTVTVTTSALDTPGTGPIITLTFKNGTWTTAPFAVVCMNGNSTGGLNVGIVCSTTATTLVITYSGTPTALSALTYIFDYVVIG